MKTKYLIINRGKGGKNKFGYMPGAWTFVKKKKATKYFPAVHVLTPPAGAYKYQAGTDNWIMCDVNIAQMIKAGKARWADAPA
jgi:hypothetical protein